MDGGLHGFGRDGSPRVVSSRQDEGKFQSVGGIAANDGRGVFVVLMIGGLEGSYAPAVPTFIGVTVQRESCILSRLDLHEAEGQATDSIGVMWGENASGFIKI